MTRRPAFVVAAFVLVVLVPAPGQAAVFGVTTNADAGPGSLRQALLDANASPGTDTVQFSLAPSDLVLTPASPLPPVTDPVVVDGTSQPGWAGAPLVELDGSTAGGTGLSVAAGDSAIVGLAIHGFDRGIAFSTFGSNDVRGCHVGTDASGTAPIGNSEYGILLASDGNRIGGSSPAERNVIVANSTGVAMTRTGSGNVVVGNHIGMGPDGLTPLGNVIGVRVLGNENFVGGTAAGERNLISGNVRGVSLEAAGAVVVGNWIGVDHTGAAPVANDEYGVGVSGSNNVVGGTTAAARNLISGNGTGVSIGAGSGNWVLGNWIGVAAGGDAPVENASGVRVLSDENVVGGSGAGEGNVISGNRRGVTLEGDRNTVSGNLIGLEPGGVHALGNGETGVLVQGANNLLGGSDPGAGNVISANGQGVAFSGSGAVDNVVSGNLIGTGASGSFNRGNLGPGIRVVDGTGNRIGGVGAGETNVISGNLRGITIEAGASSTVVQGNLIGLAASGTAPIENREAGIFVKGPGNRIGGTAPGAGNVVSGNRLYGVLLSGPAAHDNVLEGNELGSVLPGGAELRNGSAGVLVVNAFHNVIGGTVPGAGNIISANGTWGVFLRSGTGNRVLGNSIFDNGLLGIDHDRYGPTVNDPGDADFGPNRRQNHPVLDSVIASATELAVEGVLDSEPDTSYRIEFFSSPTCDPSGFGQGRTYVGAATVFTDPSGRALIDEVVPVAVSDAFVAATATSADGDTSEFSPCALVGGPNPGVLQFVMDPFVGREYEGAVPITVARSHGTSGTVEVAYSTFDMEATAPADYASVSGVLTFGPGEVLKTFDVPVVIDGIDDGGEHIGLVLENPTGGATLGRSSARLWLGDADLQLPTLFVSDASIVEGDAGAAQAVFTVRLSPSAVAISVGWETVDGTAVAGDDYEGASGELHFAPGESEKMVVVDVFGDTDLEDDEVFFLQTVGITAATVTDGIGDGVILDDDASAPALPVCVGGTSIAKPRIVVGAIGPEVGDERIVLKGGLVFAPDQPAGRTALGLDLRGAQVRVEDLGTGLVLFDRTFETQALPPGEHDVSPCDPQGKRKDGWKKNEAETSYLYRNTTNALPSAGCAPGSALGLRKLAVKDRRERHGDVRFNLMARRAQIGTVVGPLRMTLVLGAEATDGQTGACGVHQFAPSDCRWSASGARLVCE